MTEDTSSTDAFNPNLIELHTLESSVRDSSGLLVNPMSIMDFPWDDGTKELTSLKAMGWLSYSLLNMSVFQDHYIALIQRDFDSIRKLKFKIRDHRIFNRAQKPFEDLNNKEIRRLIEKVFGRD